MHAAISSGLGLAIVRAGGTSRRCTRRLRRDRGPSPRSSGLAAARHFRRTESLVRPRRRPAPRRRSTAPELPVPRANTVCFRCSADFRQPRMLSPRARRSFRSANVTCGAGAGADALRRPEPALALRVRTGRAATGAAAVGARARLAEPAARSGARRLGNRFGDWFRRAWRGGRCAMLVASDARSSPVAPVAACHST